MSKSAAFGEEVEKKPALNRKCLYPALFVFVAAFICAIVAVVLKVEPYTEEKNGNILCNRFDLELGIEYGTGVFSFNLII